MSHRADHPASESMTDYNRRKQNEALAAPAAGTQAGGEFIFGDEEEWPKVVYVGSRAYLQQRNGARTRAPEYDLPAEGGAAPRQEGVFTVAELTEAGAVQVRPGVYRLTNADGSYTDYNRNRDGTYDEGKTSSPPKAAAPTAFDRFLQATESLSRVRQQAAAQGGPPLPQSGAALGGPGNRPGEYFISPSGASIGELDPRQQPYANINPATLGYDPAQIIAAMGLRSTGDPLKDAQLAAQGMALRETYAMSRPDLSPAEVQSRFFDQPGGNLNTGYDPRPQSAISRSANPKEQVVISQSDLERLFQPMAHGGTVTASKPLELTPPPQRDDSGYLGPPEMIGQHAEGSVNPPESWSPPERPLPAVASSDIAAAQTAPRTDPMSELRRILLLIMRGGGMGMPMTSYGMPWGGMPWDTAGAEGMAGGGSVITNQPTAIGPAGGPPLAVASEYGQPELLTQTAPNALTVTPIDPDALDRMRAQRFVSLLLRTSKQRRKLPYAGVA